MILSDLGEEGLLRLLKELVGETADPGVLVGIGDDAAVITGNPDMDQLVTSDTLVEGTHFKMDTAEPRRLGRKAMAVNLSDIAAMGGSPRFAQVSLALPPRWDVETVRQVYLGLLDLCEQFNTSIIGGNLSSSEIASITITLLGEAARGSATLRSSARPGEFIMVTGFLGRAAAGLYLADHQRIAAATGGEDRSLRQALDEPVPRIAEGRAAAATGCRAMQDISDGLLLDLERLCRASQVGAELNPEQLPISPETAAVAQEAGVSAVDWALSGGEDYELLITAQPEQARKVARAVAAAGSPATVVGRIIQEPTGCVVSPAGQKLTRSHPGHDHFAGPSGGQ